MVLGMEVGLSPDDLGVLDGDPAPPKKGVEPPLQFLAHFYYGQTAGCTKMPLGMELGLSHGDFVLDGDPAPPQKGADPPNFRPMSIVAKRLGGKMALGMEVGLSSGDFMFDGDPAPSRKKMAEPPRQFSAHVYCGQTAGWIKMSLGMEVGLGPGHIVLDGEPAPLPQKGNR